MIDLTGLPGESLIRAGLEDLASGLPTVAALVLSTARDRMWLLGVELPSLPPGTAVPRQCELALYQKLIDSGEVDPYVRYNALLRELASFLEIESEEKREVPEVSFT